MNKHRARKRFGQHFLQDSNVVTRIVASINPQQNDHIVEIGPGLGVLTEALLACVPEMDAVELDRDIIPKLAERCGTLGTLNIHAADALQFDFTALASDKRPLRIVGNLPYNISTPLLFHLLKFRDNILDMHFMLQKEVVARMAAGPGSKAYGRLGIMLGCHLQVESLFDVDREAFAPPPDVTSSVARLDPLPPGTYEIDDEAGLSTLVATAFMQRRKTLRNALRKVADARDFEVVGIDAGVRPEQVSIASFIALSNHLRQKSR